MSSASRAPFCMSERSPASASSSPGSGGEPVELGDGMLEPFAVAGGGLQILARPGQRRLGLAPGAIGALRRGAVDPAERVEQGAVAARIEQAAIVMLAVDLDEQGAELADQGDRGGLVVDQGPAAAVGADDPADDERLARLALEAVVAEQAEGGMVGAEGRS